MLLGLMRGNSFRDTLLQILVSAFIVFCILPIHEYAHAYVANKRGDRTAELAGRLTLNPLSHIDLVGALMIFIAGFGYAKPVPINMNNLKKPRTDMAWVAAAGPISNLLIALIFALINGIFVNLFYKNPTTIYEVAAYFFSIATLISINLAVFNLLPIPPLDGSKILSVFMPRQMYYDFLRYEKYISIAVFILIITGILSRPISFVSGLIYSLFMKFAALLF